MSTFQSTLEKEEECCAVIPTVSAQEVREFRDQLGLTQEQFARRYGVSLRTIRRWEGASAPTITKSFWPLLNHLLRSRMDDGRPPVGQAALHDSAG